MFKIIFEIFVLLVCFAFVLGLTYLLTRFIAVSQKNRLKTKNMEIIETLSLGIDKALHLTRVGSSFYLIGISNKTITFLTEISKEDVDLTNNTSKETIDFKVYLDKIIKLQKKQRGK